MWYWKITTKAFTSYLYQAHEITENNSLEKLNSTQAKHFKTKQQHSKLFIKT